MKLLKLELENILSYEKAKLKLNKVNMIQGKNTVGKTNIAIALRIGIGGIGGPKKKVSDRIGEKLIIKNGCDSGKAIFTFSVDNIVTKSITRATSTLRLKKGANNSVEKEQYDVYRLFYSNFDGELNRIDNLLKKYVADKESSKISDLNKYKSVLIDITEKKISAALNGERCLDLPLKDRKQFFFDLSGNNLTKELLIKLLQEKEIPTELTTKVAEKVIASSFEDAEKSAVERRRKFKNDRDALKTDLPKDENIIYKGNKYFYHQLQPQSIETDLAAIQKKNGELQQEKGRLSQIIEANNFKETSSQISRLRIEINDIEKYIKHYQPVSEIESKILENGKKIKIYDEEYNDAINKLAKVDAELAVLNEQKNNIESIKDNKCFVCNHEISSDELKNLKDNIEKSIRKTPNRKSLLDDSKTMSEKKDELTKTTTELINIIPVLQQKGTDLEKSRNNFDGLQDKLKDATQKAVTAKNDLETLNLELDKVQSAETVVQDVLTKVKRYFEDLKKHEMNKIEIEKISKNVDLYDKLQKLLNPKDGIINEILKAVFKPIQACLDEINEYELMDPVKLNDDFSFSVGDRQELQIDRFGSEYLRLCFILAVMIAKFAKFPILIFDRLETLIEDNRIKFAAFIEAIKKDFENIILISSRNDSGINADNAPELSDYTFFWIEDGRAKKMN